MVKVYNGDVFRSKSEFGIFVIGKNPDAWGELRVLL